MGPACQLLLKYPINAGQIKELDTYIRDIGEIESSSDKTRWDFYVMSSRYIPQQKEEIGCPFTLSLLPGNGDYDDNQMRQIADYTGYIPGCVLLLYAGCSSNIDQLLLAEIALAILGKYEGYIDFTGYLQFKETDAQLSGRIAGNIFSISYSVEDDIHSYHIASKEFLQAWIKSGNFSMIK